MARPRIHDDTLRERLLEEGIGRVAEVGVEALSLRSVTAACDTSTSAVYTLFGDKQGFVDAIARRADASFTAAQRDALAAVAAGDDPFARLRALGEGYRAWARSEPAAYAVLFGPDSARVEDYTAFDPVLEEVTALVEAGHLLGDPEATAQGIWAMTHGFVTLEAAVWAGDPSVEDRWNRYLDAVITGWRS